MPPAFLTPQSLAVLVDAFNLQVPGPPGCRFLNPAAAAAAHELHRVSHASTALPPPLCPPPAAQVVDAEHPERDIEKMLAGK